MTEDDVVPDNVIPLRPQVTPSSAPEGMEEMSVDSVYQVVVSLPGNLVGIKIGDRGIALTQENARRVAHALIVVAEMLEYAQG